MEVRSHRDIQPEMERFIPRCYLRENGVVDNLCLFLFRFIYSVISLYYSIISLYYSTISSYYSVIPAKAGIQNLFGVMLVPGERG